MIPEPHCYERRCKHFAGVSQPDGTEASEVVVCPAYPDGIPARIAFGTELHTSVQKDQVGMTVFEVLVSDN